MFSVRLRFKGVLGTEERDIGCLTGSLVHNKELCTAVHGCRYTIIDLPIGV